MEKERHIVGEAMDYMFAGAWSKRLNEPTKYKGKGRPRTTDYSFFEHPFDKKITKSLNK